MKKYLYGSEWRKWDFHVHTPFSILNNRFGVNPEVSEEFDRYVVELFNRAFENNVEAIGITDYFSVEGYKKLKNEYLSKPEVIERLFPDAEVQDRIRDIYFFVNIEFRLNKFVGERDSSINFHVIFSDEVTIENIEQNFLQRLEFCYEGSPQTVDHTRILCRHNIAEFGDKLKKEQGFEGDAYKVGLEHLVIDDSKIMEVLTGNPIFKEKYLICVPPDEDLCRINWAGRDHNTRKTIIQKSDCLMASNPNTIKWALGEKIEDIQDFLDEFKTIKPCIWGSDAHDFESMYKPSQDRCCWIKAELTFNGLKQVIYEPKERVRIQPNKPEAKTGYYVIDHVRIEDENFMPEAIYFSENLTCIIGGKSTGKSLILHNMAFAIDQNQVQEKCRISESRVRPVNNVEISWKDGYVSSSRNTVDRKIVYIPQTYLNRLSDEKEETTEIDDIIKEIVLQNPEIVQEYERLSVFENEAKAQLDKTIYDYQISLQEIRVIQNNILESGDASSISIELEKLKSEKVCLVEKSSLSEEDVVAYDVAEQNVKSIQGIIFKLESDMSIIRGVDSLSILDSFTEKLQIGFIKDYAHEEINSIRVLINEKWKESQTKVLDEIQTQIYKLQTEKEKNQNIVDHLRPLVEYNEQLRELSIKIETEEAKLRNANELDSGLKHEMSKSEELLKSVIESRQGYHDAYQLFVSFVNERQRTLDVDDMEFRLEVVWRKDRFMEMLKRLLDNRSMNRLTGYNLKELRDNHYNSDFLFSLCKSIVSEDANTLELKQGYSVEEAFRQIFKNWYNINYIVTMDDDIIYDMSPGKKALVLLKLLIGLAESRCPILIDQPEDDLDNRSIYEDLVKYMKQRKKDRQIIVVTHNANIVLGGDAEQVIVANQNGKNAPNRQYKFEYRSGAIENDRKLFDQNSVVLNGVLNEKGVQTHICEILEGGKQAFDLRKSKYYSV